MEYSEVQRIARNTIEYIKGEIHSGMALTEVRRLCEEKMYELGADSFWYYDIGAFVFSGMRLRFPFPEENILLRTGSLRQMIFLP